MTKRANKIFAGNRIRRMRKELNITQAQMADDLVISTSYLNLLERNQRPLSAQILLRLASAFDINLKEFSGDDDSHAAASLKEIFSDPLFKGLKLSDHELTDLVGASPSAVQSVLTLYRAYRESLTNNAAMAEQLANQEGTTTSNTSQFPIEEVRDYFHDTNNYFPELENAAETLWADAALSIDNLYAGLKDHLKSAHDISVRITPIDVLPDTTWRLDRHSRRLFISEIVKVPSRAFQLALHAGLIGYRNLFDELVLNTGLQSEEAKQLCRLGLANYFAGAVVMPYEQFQNAATQLRYDIDLLGQRFSSSYEQTSHRLTTLQRPGSRGVPFFFLRVDHAGNISNRFSASGFHFARFGGTCPRWNIHAAFRTPNKIIPQIVGMEDGTRYFTISRTVSNKAVGYNMAEQQRSIGIGCKIDYAHQLIYSDGLNITEESAVTPIGVNCRLCMRMNCHQRANPPLNRQISLADNYRGVAPYTFAEL